jgi:CheY-like chemotaxis protein
MAQYTKEEEEIQEQPRANESLAVYLKNVRTCVQSLRETNDFMLMTINRCIDYAKATKGVKLVPRLETINLLETLQLPLHCLRSVQSRVAILLKDLPITVCSHVITDKQWLQENLLCLLSNAVKYSSTGDVLVTVQLITEQESIRTHMSESCKESRSVLDVVNENGTTSSWLLFEVEDRGIGVPSDALQYLFQPFKQTQRLAGGTGLGLYSLAKRVEALNGMYGVRGRRDEMAGSLFWFTIPYRPDAVSAQATTCSEATIAPFNKASTINHLHPNQPHDTAIPNITLFLHQPDCSSPPTSPKLISNLDILLVDDALSIVKMTSLMLRKLGHRITAAENGEVAVKIVENRWKEEGKSFDLILMDLQMPVMDGLEATKRIRKMEGVLQRERSSEELSADASRFLPKHFIVGVSANSDSETESNAIEHGADAFIAKPFTLDTFTTLLQDRLTTPLGNQLSNK